MPEGRTTTWVPGDWNAICDICGWKYKASQLRKNWMGLMVCDKDWEPRQPQDFARGEPDIMTPPWTRPEQTPSYASTNYVQLIATSAQLAAGSTVYQSNASSDTVEAHVQYTMTFTGFIKSLTVSTDAAPGQGTFTYTVRKNAANVSTFAGTISGGSNYDLQISGSVAVTSGDKIDVRIVTSSGAAATFHYTTLLVTT